MRGGKDLKTIRKKLAALALTGILVATLGNGILVSAENQGTNGPEIQVMEAEQLEVQLGKEWAGREFQLKTDAGLYPGTITVGEDGVLRTELGGSTRYILTCMLTENPDDTEQVLATRNDLSKDTTNAPEQEGEMESQSGENASGETETGVQQTTPADASTGPAVKGEATEKTVAGIPVKHLVLFSVGMVAAVGFLITIHFTKRHQVEYDEESDEDEE